MSTQYRVIISSLIAVLGSACSTPRHEILGSNGSGWPLSSANIISDVKINDLRVRHVRILNAECKSGSHDHLEISGPIGIDSSEVIERVLKTFPLCESTGGRGRTVPAAYLNSSGGTLRDGFRLGQTFRKYYVQVMVLGGQQCSSACAIAFLGGHFRTISGDGQLLFHSPYVGSGFSIECIERERAQEMKRYMVTFLNQKDGEFLFDRTISYCSQTTGWTINADAAKLFGITTP